MLLPQLILALASSVCPQAEGPGLAPSPSSANAPALDRPTVAQEPAPDAEPKGQDSGDTLEIRSSSFVDGLARARRLERYLVTVWARPDQPHKEALIAATLRDPEVLRWLNESAIVIEVDTIKNRDEANANGATTVSTPCLDILDTSSGALVQRMGRGATATDFLAAVVGIDPNNAPTRPTGADAKKPFRWLAWGNWRFIQGDPAAGEESTEAYSWLLSTAEAYRPGFRSRFFEYLVQRLNQNRGRTPGAFDVLRREIEGLGGEVSAGIASRRTTYEFTRLVQALKQDELLRSTYKDLCGPPPARGATADQRARIRLWLLSDAAPILGRFKEYGELLSGVGDSAADYFTRRVNALDRATAAREAESKGEAAVEAPDKTDADFAPLPHAVEDSAKDLVRDAAWIFEALAATDREEEARALFSLAADRIHDTTVHAEFALSAIRVKAFDMAAEFLDLGDAEAEGNGVKRMKRIRRRLVTAMAKDAKDKDPAPAGATGDDGK